MKQMQFDESQLQKFGVDRTLSSFIQHLEADLDKEGMVLCRISVDGMALDEKDEARLSAVPLSTVGEITIDVESGSNICLQVIDGWLETIPWLQEQSSKLAERFRFDGCERQLKPFAELVDSCSFLVQSLVSLKPQVVDEDQLKDWTEAEKSFRTIVNDMLQAFQKSDFVLLSDLLEYDFCTVLTTWHRLMARMHDTYREN